MSAPTKQRILVCVAVERTTYYTFEVEAADESEANDIAYDNLFDWDAVALDGIEEVEETGEQINIWTGDEARA